MLHRKTLAPNLLELLKELAPVKLNAVSQHGRKKDFYDLYYLLQYFSLPQLLEFYEAKYFHTSVFHIIKSICYFAEAEGENDPIVFDKKVTWEKVKKEIVKAVQKI